MPSNNKQTLNGNFKGQDILSLNQFDTKSISTLFSHTPQMAEIAKNAAASNLLKGNLATLLFYEPSSRTFGSFAAAIKQLGGQTIDIQDPKAFSSVAKGETLDDTIQVFEAYSDLVVLRHSEKGAAQTAAEAAKNIPVINAGDGIGEHPTQALLDMYTIFEKFKRLDHLTGLLAGDLLNGRTVHSLLRGLALYPGNTIYLLSPQNLKLPSNDIKKLQTAGLTIHEIQSEKDIPKNADFWYWTRVQKERFQDLSEYERIKTAFIVTPKLLDTYGNKEMILMHPLPRVGEILPEVDSDKRAVYLKNQIRNGMYIRMALVALVLGKIK